jgi:3-oxoacyl-[acyl-carrier protein] reductase
VINIGSIAGSNSMPNAAPYSATKAAIENLTQGLSAELGPRKIRVNAIAPGYMRSEGTKAEGLLAQESIKRYASITPPSSLPDIDSPSKTDHSFSENLLRWA